MSQEYIHYSTTQTVGKLSKAIKLFNRNVKAFYLFPSSLEIHRLLNPFNTNNNGTPNISYKEKEEGTIINSILNNVQ